MFDVQAPERMSAGTLGAPQQRKSVFGNQLLDALPKAEIAILSSYLRRVYLHRGDELMRDAADRQSMYFPVDAFLWSWANTTQTDRPTLLLATGRRGVIGFDALAAGARADVRTHVLCPGSAWRLCVPIASEQSTSEAFGRALFQFCCSALRISSYRLACNSEHNVDKRVARWLLWIADETGRPEASMTHQQFADLAAIRRPSVSLAFADLARRDIIRVHNSLIQILDAERLERAACTCHAAITAESALVTG